MHLGNPIGRWLYLAHRSQLVRRVTRSADVVDTLKHELDVADFEHLAAAFFCQATSSVDDAVHKVVGNAQDGL